MIRALAHAKVNLCLEVLGRREDGYHEVATVLQALALADELTAEPAEALTLTCTHPGLGGEGNLVLQAARRLREAAGVRVGARMALRKTIPVAMGLGGGSADAAAALLALDRLWGIGLQPRGLARLGAGLGADVPFFLGATGTALAEGMGERVTPLASPPHAWIVLALPQMVLPERKTAAFYALLQAEDYTSGGQASRWAARLEEGASWAALLTDPGAQNAFEAPVLRTYPSLRIVWSRFVEAARRSLAVRLAGSGPALYAPFPERAEAEHVRAELVADGFQAIVTETAARPVDLSES